MDNKDTNDKILITGIDEILDKHLDIFNDKIIQSKQFKNKILNEIQFTKNQEDINKLLVEYTDKYINDSEIKEIVNTTDNINMIKNIIKKYIIYHLFLTIGFFYKGTDNEYNDNIIDFSLNQHNFNFKINNFFNGENNATIIKMNKFIKNFDIQLNEIDKKDKKEQDYDVSKFISGMTNEIIEALKKLKSDKSNYIHNLIKIVLLSIIYIKNDKKDIRKLIESEELNNIEYIYIDIILPKEKRIDLNDLESLFTTTQNKSGLAHRFWELLKDETKPKYIKTTEDKINEILNSKMFVPIVDDILLFHKDSEKYGQPQDKTKKKNKDSTKIKYIINKIDMAIDLNNNPDNKKVFYTPMNDKNVVLINENEEIKIINKILFQGQKFAEEHEYFNDLINYRKYPYISFKDPKKNAVQFIIGKRNDTIDLVRYSSIEHKSVNLYNRVGFPDQTINIMGLIIPSSNIRCMKTNELKDVKKIVNKSNGYDAFIDYLNKNKLIFKDRNESIYWLFDNEKDHVEFDTYEQIDKLTTNEQMKYKIGNLYDEIQKIIINLINNKFENIQINNINNAYDILEQYEQFTLNIPKDINTYHDIEYNILHKWLPKELKETINYDDLLGYYGELVKLPIVQPRAKPEMTELYITNKKTDKTKEGIKNDTIIAICQHYITWELIFEAKKKSILQYSNMVYDFVQQYAVENTEHEYVCKSCGTLLDIKKLVVDGTYDNETQRFVTFGTYIDIPLEDIIEYEKYKGSIRAIEKNVEKVGSISNLSFLTGISGNAKWARKVFIKDTIDLLLSNNKLLKSIYKNRKEQITQKYGLDKNMSNMFVFELDNSIFTFSSKDKDLYKMIKLNTIMSYVVLLVTLDLADSQLSFLIGNKYCNYKFFMNYYQKIFGDMKIIINRDGETSKIINYPVLCYILYIISGMLATYGLWLLEEKKEGIMKKKIEFDPRIQISAINTVVDILNATIELTITNSDIHIYEILSTKYFLKLRGLYDDNNILKKFFGESGDEKKIKKFIGISKHKPVQLNGIYSEMKLRDTNYSDRTKYKRYGKIKENENKNIYKTKFSNCINGDFHKWESKTLGNEIKCSLCGLTYNEIDTKKIDNSEINDKYINFKNLKLADKYCPSGDLHEFKYDATTNTEICKICGNQKGKQYTDNEINKLIDILNKKNKENKKECENKNVKKTIKNDEIIDNFNNNKNKIKDFIKIFTNKLIENIGLENSYENINDNNYNNYIIDHNHLGNKLKDPIIISEKNVKIKKDHSTFKSDVLIAFIPQQHIEMYYDMNTKILIGYREQNKDIVENKVVNRKIIKNYALVNKINLLGYDEININLSKLSENNQLKKNIREIIINRIENLKQIINDLIYIIHNIKNIGKGMIPKNPILNKYYKKITNINYIIDNDTIFNDYKIITTTSLKTLNDQFIKIDIKTGIIDVSEFENYSDVCNLLLYYLVNKMILLIDINQNKVTKINIVNMLVDFINLKFEQYNKEISHDNLDIIKFINKLDSSMLMETLSQLEYESSTDIYGEYKDPNAEKTEEDIEKEIDEKEETEAMTMEDEEDDTELSRTYIRVEDSFDKNYEIEKSIDPNIIGFE